MQNHGSKVAFAHSRREEDKHTPKYIDYRDEAPGRTAPGWRIRASPNQFPALKSRGL